MVLVLAYILAMLEIPVEWFFNPNELNPKNRDNSCVELVHKAASERNVGSST